jgi:DNA-binding MarR family transcriptional regulator
MESLEFGRDMDHETPTEAVHAPTISRREMLDDGRDDRFRGLLHDMLAISARLEHVRGRFGAFIGLSGPQYTILAAIRQFQYPDGVGVKELADRLRLSGAFVTIETNKLAKLALISKTTNPRDQRRVNLALTARGAEALATLAPLQREVNDLLFEPLSRDDFGQLCRILRALGESAARAGALADYLMDDARDEG